MKLVLKWFNYHLDGVDILKVIDIKSFTVKKNRDDKRHNLIVVVNDNTNQMKEYYCDEVSLFHD